MGGVTRNDDSVARLTIGRRLAGASESSQKGRGGLLAERQLSPEVKGGSSPVGGSRI